MLYIVIAVAYCLLVLFGLAMCRVSALSDQAHARELADRLTAARLERRGQTQHETPGEAVREARRAAG